MAGFARTVQKLGHDERIVCFRPSTASRRNHRNLPQQLTARLIRYQKPGFRPSFLLTSLIDSKQFTRDELVNLYHRRWRIETIYREWKHTLRIQNLRSQTPLGICKEIYAHLTTSNLVRWIMTQAATGTTTPVELSFTTAISYIKTAVSSMAFLPPRHLRHAYRQLIENIRNALIRQRPGRSYPRLRDATIKNMGKGKYKLPARIKPQTLRQIA
jgi:hypothetical protein